MAKCIVCGFQVDMSTANKRTFIDPVGIAAGIERKSVIIVCAGERCQRLVFEALKEEGRREVKK